MKQERLRRKQQRIERQNDPDAATADDVNDDVSDSDSDDDQDVEFEGGFRVPGKIWKKLYRYLSVLRCLWSCIRSEFLKH